MSKGGAAKSGAFFGALMALTVVILLAAVLLGLGFRVFVWAAGL